VSVGLKTQIVAGPTHAAGEHCVAGTVHHHVRRRWRAAGCGNWTARRARSKARGVICLS
jgi:hypothetical protein